MRLAKTCIGLFLMCLISGCSRVEEQPFLLSTESVQISSAVSIATETTSTTVSRTTTSTETTTERPVETETEFTSEITTFEVESVTEPFYDFSETYTETKIEEIYYSSSITEQERIMLCNLVAREYGSDWVSTYEKAKVVAVVMNRVNSNLFPNTIYEVLTQPNQFYGYIPYDYYTSTVTQSVQDSVDYYFSHTDEFGSYLYFEGYGTYNYFH